MMTSSEVSAKLNIQPSTLRKYSALLEQEGIQFKQTHEDAAENRCIGRPVEAITCHNTG